MQFYIDILDSSGTRIGAGPITSAEYWESTNAVDRIGSFSFTMPASDPMAAHIIARRVARCYAILATGPTIIGSGIIDTIETQPNSDGNAQLIVSGANLLRELVWRTVESLALISGTSAVTHVVAVANVGIYKPAGWIFTQDPTPPNNEIYYFFAGETVYAAALLVAELSRTHLWMPTERTLQFQSTWPDSGLRAIEAGAAPNSDAANVCLIGGLSIVQGTYDLISRVLAYGAELPGTISLPQFVTLFSSNRVPPTGYTFSQLGGIDTYLKRDATEATYGRVESFLKFNDIKAASTGAADLLSASNTLFDAALWELQRRSEPSSFYRLDLIHAPGIIAPMQKIRCIFRRSVDGRNVVSVDQSLYILAATTRVDASGLRTTSLDVSTIDRWPQAETNPIVEATKNNLRIR